MPDSKKSKVWVVACLKVVEQENWEMFVEALQHDFPEFTGFKQVYAPFKECTNFGIVCEDEKAVEKFARLLFPARYAPANDESWEGFHNYISEETEKSLRILNK